MLVCHQAFYARTDFAIATPYDMQYRFSADVDWCIRVMKAADKERVPLLNLKMVVANYTEEGQTTQHHRESLWERYHVMERHYGRVQTFLLHAWLPCDGTALWPCADLPVARLVCSPFAFQIRKAPSSFG